MSAATDVPSVAPNESQLTVKSPTISEQDVHG